MHIVGRTRLARRESGPVALDDSRVSAGLGRTAHNGALQAQARPPRCPLGPAIGEEVEALGECGALLS